MLPLRRRETPRGASGGVCASREPQSLGALGDLDLAYFLG
jgi:hypothetical protein